MTTPEPTPKQRDDMIRAYVQEEAYLVSAIGILNNLLIGRSKQVGKASVLLMERLQEVRQALEEDRKKQASKDTTE